MWGCTSLSLAFPAWRGGPVSLGVVDGAPHAGEVWKLTGGRVPSGVGASLLVEDHSCSPADTVANHIPASWPQESLAGSDSEEPGGKPHLKVETKVSVELHLNAQGGHCSERPQDRESGGLPKPEGVLPGQPPEQRKGAWEWQGSC